MTRTATGAVDIARLQRRTVGTLVSTQALGGVGVTLGFATLALLAEDISGSASLAGLAQTTQVLGSAVAAYLLARVMGARGRRTGLALGYALGATGAALCVVAGVVGSFVLLLLASALVGATIAANNQSRYAATDLAAPERRARALAVVVWATTIGAVAGPNLAGAAGDLARAWSVPPLAGPFLVGAVGMALAGVVVLLGLRPDPLLTARALADAERVRPVEPDQVASTSWGRVGAVLRERPAVLWAVAGMSLAHAVMIAVMGMTPLHMHHGGATLQVIGIVISVHVLGMYALSPLVGWAADRWGRPAVLGGGALVMLAALVVSGTSPSGASGQITVGLFLLGLGWSGATVAASTLLTEESPLEARTDVQGAADLAMGLTAAAAGGLAGVVIGTLGYAALNAAAGVLAVGVGLAAVQAHRRRAGMVPTRRAR
ncbi:MAG: MFS transporter [Nocardioides sp.]|nr:MFS transporter [Nocardioides sp.]